MFRIKHLVSTAAVLASSTAGLHRAQPRRPRETAPYPQRRRRPSVVTRIVD